MTLETELAGLLTRTAPRPPALTIEQEMAVLLANAGPERAPTLEKARAWLWCASDARERAEAAMKRPDWDLAAAYRDLARELEGRR